MSVLLLGGNFMRPFLLNHTHHVQVYCSAPRHIRATYQYQRRFPVGTHEIKRCTPDTRSLLFTDIPSWHRHNIPPILNHQSYRNSPLILGLTLGEGVQKVAPHVSRLRDPCLSGPGGWLLVVSNNRIAGKHTKQSDFLSCLSTFLCY